MKTIAACQQHSMFDGLEASPREGDRPGFLSATFAKPVGRNGIALVPFVRCYQCRWSGDPVAVYLDLPRLPDLEAVGGNARPGHPMQAARNTSEEREAWQGYIRTKWLPPYPHMGLARAWVVLYFAQERDRDQDNLARSLKPLWDTLKPVERGGLFGVLDNDDVKHLQVVEVRVEVDPQRAPLTELTLLPWNDGPKAKKSSESDLQVMLSSGGQSVTTTLGELKDVNRQMARGEGLDNPVAKLAREVVQEAMQRPKPLANMREKEKGNVQTIKTTSRSLPVHLEQAEVVARSRELASTVQEHAQEERQQESLKKQMKSKLEEMDARIARLSDVVASGIEPRQVTVEYRFEPTTGQLTEVRTDTGEAIMKRAPTDEERQMVLELKAA